MGNFLIKVTATGYKFDLLARNGRIIATSEVYQTLASCKVGISSVKRNAPLAAFCDLTLPCPKMRKIQNLNCIRIGQANFGSV